MFEEKEADYFDAHTHLLDYPTAEDTQEVI